MAVFLALLGTSSFVHTMIDHKPHAEWVDHCLNWVPIISLAGFYISFSLGFQPVIRVLVGAYAYRVKKKSYLVQSIFIQIQTRHSNSSKI